MIKWKFFQVLVTGYIFNSFHQSLIFPFLELIKDSVRILQVVIDLNLDGLVKIINDINDFGIFFLGLSILSSIPND